MEWFASGLKASNGSIDSAPKDQWSASERARQVAQNDALQALLNAEIHKSGFLTSAGHKAVVQKFLRSDEVDEEMTKAGDAKPQEGLFRRLLSSGSAASSAGSVNFSQESSRGIASALRRLSGDLLAAEIDFDPPCDACDGDDGGTNDRVERNIAPRRASCDRGTNKMLLQLKGIGCRPGPHSPTFLNCEVPAPSRPDEGGRCSEDASRDEAPDSLDGRLPRPLIVKTKPPANYEDEAPAPPRPDESWRSSKDASHDDVLDSLRRFYGSWRRFSDGSADLTRSVRSDEDSCADECGWLPWPSEGKGDAPDGDVHMVSLENMQLQEH